MRRKILIVDDTQSIRMLIKLVLGTDYDYVEAADGADGVTKALAESPDLILLDLQMPVRDGVSALQILKKHEITSRTPVLMVSTLVGSDNETTRACRELGAAGFVSKPIQRDTLVQLVRDNLAS